MSTLEGKRGKQQTVERREGRWCGVCLCLMCVTLMISREGLGNENTLARGLGETALAAGA